jgi:putative iron-dependent peroxidase
MPFGEVGAAEFGTYFIGYTRRPDVLEEMLTNMFIGRPPGNHDRILDFSTAVTGNLFFVPPSSSSTTRHPRPPRQRRRPRMSPGMVRSGSEA